LLEPFVKPYFTPLGIRLVTIYEAPDLRTQLVLHEIRYATKNGITPVKSSRLQQPLEFIPVCHLDLFHAQPPLQCIRGGMIKAQSRATCSGSTTREIVFMHL